MQAALSLFTKTKRKSGALSETTSARVVVQVVTGTGAPVRGLPAGSGVSALPRLGAVCLPSLSLDGVDPVQAGTTAAGPVFPGPGSLLLSQSHGS